MKHLLGESSPSEQALVQEWIQSDPGHKSYFDELTRIWDKSLQLASTSQVDENRAWVNFQQRINSNGKTVPVKRIKSNWLSIAASIILVIGLGIAGYWFFNQETAVQPMTVATQGQVLTDTLPDGSTVTLNRKSSISYPSRFNKNNREVKLKGEAFFHVTPDKKKPFVITVNDVTVTVVGTSFNVKETNGITEVIVETGIVRVSRNGETVELKAKEKTVISSQDSTAIKETVTDQLYNYYRSRELVCDATPLWKLVDVLNEAYDSKIIIGRKEIRDLPLSTTFINSSLDEVLEIIRLSLDIKVIRKGDQIILE